MNLQYNSFTQILCSSHPLVQVLFENTRSFGVMTPTELADWYEHDIYGGDNEFGFQNVVSNGSYFGFWAYCDHGGNGDELMAVFNWKGELVALMNRDPGILHWWHDSNNDWSVAYEGGDKGFHWVEIKAIGFEFLDEVVKKMNPEDSFDLRDPAKRPESVTDVEWALLSEQDEGVQLDFCFYRDYVRQVQDLISPPIRSGM